jgi:YD repeat-containing protein
VSLSLRVILQVAAYRALWSAHDVATTRHRYTRDELGKKVERASPRWSGLPIGIPAVAFGHPGQAPSAGAGEHCNAGRPRRATAPRNRALFVVVVLENYVARRVRLPFGVSIFCVARKLSAQEPSVPVFCRDTRRPPRADSDPALLSDSSCSRRLRRPF